MSDRTNIEKLTKELKCMRQGRGFSAQYNTVRPPILGSIFSAMSSIPAQAMIDAINRYVSTERAQEGLIIAFALDLGDEKEDNLTERRTESSDMHKVTVRTMVRIEDDGIHEIALGLHKDYVLQGFVSEIPQVDAPSKTLEPLRLPRPGSRGCIPKTMELAEQQVRVLRVQSQAFETELKKLERIQTHLRRLVYGSTP